MRSERVEGVRVVIRFERVRIWEVITAKIGYLIGRGYFLQDVVLFTERWCTFCESGGGFVTWEVVLFIKGWCFSPRGGGTFY